MRPFIQIFREEKAALNEEIETLKEEVERLTEESASSDARFLDAQERYLSTLKLQEEQLRRFCFCCVIEPTLIRKIQLQERFD